MKKIASFLLALVLCFGLAGCGEKEEPVTFDDMPITAIRNVETGDTIELGMSQGEIEDIIGKGEDEGDGYFYYGTEDAGLSIDYDGHMAESVSVIRAAPWKVKHGVGTGDKAMDMFRYYGETEIEELDVQKGRTIISITYDIEDEGEKSYISAVLQEDKETIQSIGIFKS